ncbi:bifunctional nuclease family protein [Planctomycetota bacterium]
MAESDELVKIRIKKVLGPTQTGTAVLLGNDEKTFVMFIGYNEGAALIRELSGEEPARPFTHELLSYILTGFDIEIKQIVISDIMNNTFCATLILEQKVVDENEQWVGKRNEVRIDARPSDCLVLACKAKKDIYCTRQVLEKVRDVSEVTEDSSEGEGESKGGKASEGLLPAGPAGGFLKDMWEQIDQALSQDEDEDD